MEAIDKIREAGLKLTPQRKAVYEAMMELRHAPIEAIISCVQSKRQRNNPFYGISYTRFFL